MLKNLGGRNMVVSFLLLVVYWPMCTVVASYAAPAPWQTVQLSPNRELVLRTAGARVGVSKWQAVQADVVAGTGLIKDEGSVTAFNPTGSTSCEPPVWHMVQRSEERRVRKECR